MIRINYKIFTLIFLILCSCQSTYEFRKLSHAVYQSNLIHSNTKKVDMEKFFHEIRCKMNSKYEINFIDYHEDTVYITTSYNYGWGGLTISIFNRSNSISASRSATYPKDSLQIFLSEIPYSDRFKKDIQNWDTGFIRRMSLSIDKGRLPAIEISRVIIKNKKFSIQNIRNIYEY